MKFIHDKKIIDRYSDHYTVLVSVNNVTNHAPLIEFSQNLSSKISENYLKDNIFPLTEKWQAVFSNMGAKPKYKSSLTSLYDYFQSKNKLYKINPIVDFYNLYSLYMGMPMAAYDSNMITGTLSLTEPGKDFEFSPLGNPTSRQKTKEREIAYIDEEKVICRYWNLQDCDETKITDKTKNILFVFDVISNQNEVNEILKKIIDDYGAIFSGNIQSGITGIGIGNELSL
ncbi:B3/4 domain-containing protein [Methylomonas sp. ZR1]|uniref:B3/B4 domain-containing protein n=1 Tax=Methylomonas sp. ZR1 TaxID=1797072 RepID=UPI0014932881|nr:phenylalanine--tRNA ligase beta subunit-related protein [Methylomonas sp. ZR1]NOV29742.1 hypothetical protein [Methylomonas sp. ZR1]